MNRVKAILSKQNRALLAELVRTDFKLRYQGSALGYVWSLLRPLLIFVILYIVFVKFIKLGTDVPHYPVYLLIGIVLWNFFNEITLQSTTSIVGRGDLIRKIRIPRWTIVIATSLSALINLGLNFVIIAIFMVINHVGISDTLPFALLAALELYIFGLGVSFFLATFYVKFRDISYIWEVVMQAGFYITPIIYPLSRITNHTLQKLILLSPVAQTIQDVRYGAVTHQALTISGVFQGGYYKFIPFVIVILVATGGAFYFRKESKYFAENI